MVVKMVGGLKKRVGAGEKVVLLSLPEL